jgi:hypothetical protein
MLPECRFRSMIAGLQGLEPGLAATINALPQAVACRTRRLAHTHFRRNASLTSTLETSSAVLSLKAVTAVVAGANRAANRNPLPVLAFHPRLRGGVILLGAAHANVPRRTSCGQKNVVTAWLEKTASTANRAEGGRRTGPKRAPKPPVFRPKRPLTVPTTRPNDRVREAARRPGRSARAGAAQILSCAARTCAPAVRHRHDAPGARRKPRQRSAKPASRSARVGAAPCRAQFAPRVPIGLGMPHRSPWLYEPEPSSSYPKLGQKQLRAAETPGFPPKTAPDSARTRPPNDRRREAAHRRGRSAGAGDAPALSRAAPSARRPRGSAP